MGKGFLKLKKKIYLNILIKSLLCGLAVGLLVLSTLLYLDRQMIREIELFVSILCSAGVMLLVTGLLFLILRPSKRRLARRLDRKLQLKEQVQTMVAFEGETGEMYSLQREHTDSILAEAPLKRLKMMRGVWISAVATTLSLAALVTVVLIPQKQAAEPVTPEGPPQKEETPFEVSEWQLIRLQNLIKEVKESHMTDGAKTSVVLSLETLLAELPGVKTVSAMKNAVVDVIKEVRAVVKETNTYRAISDTLKRGERSPIIKLGETVSLPERTDLRDRFKEIRDEVKKDAEGEALTELSKELAWLLGRTSVSSKDPLLSALDALAAAIGQAAEAQDAAAELDAAFEALFLSANAALADQVADRTVGDHVVAELMDIFALTEEELPESDEDSSDSSEEENDKKDEEIVGEGGIGTGEMLFGSDDTVYDPDGHTHVKYGDVIFDYYALVLDAIQNGDLSEEWKQYIGDYFAALLGSANAPGNTNGNTENNDG